MNGRTLALSGGALAAVMSVLMFVGTTSLGLFLTYAALWLTGATGLAIGLRREKAQTFARLEQERQGR